MGATTKARFYGAEDLKPGDWIKYRSSYYTSGRLAEVHALGSDARCGPYAVTIEGNVLFERIVEIRRRPLNVLVVPRLSTRQDEPAASSLHRCGVRNNVRSGPMSTIAGSDGKKQREPHQEPGVPDDDGSDLLDDQADSGPDRDHEELT